MSGTGQACRLLKVFHRTLEVNSCALWETNGHFHKNAMTICECCHVFVATCISPPWPWIKAVSYQEVHLQLIWQLFLPLLSSHSNYEWYLVIFSNCFPSIQLSPDIAKTIHHIIFFSIMVMTGAFFTLSTYQFEFWNPTKVWSCFCNFFRHLVLLLLLYCCYAFIHQETTQ